MYNNIILIIDYFLFITRINIFFRGVLLIMKKRQIVTRAGALELILKQITDTLAVKGSCVVAIDGNSGAGKSTLAAQIVKESGGNLFHTDDYFLPSHLRTEDRLNTPGGNVDYDRFNNEIINGISCCKDFSYKAYSCSDGTFSVINVKSSPINIIEGSYSHHPLWSDKIDIKVFMSIDYDAQIMRIRKRNGEEMLSNFTNKWIPLENTYFEHYDIAGNSDITVFS